MPPVRKQSPQGRPYEPCASVAICRGKIPVRIRNEWATGGFQKALELNLNDAVVTHNEQARQFEATVRGLHAFLTYRQTPDRMILLHTEVPAPLEGQGLAARLTRAALDFARAHRLRVVPLCPYVADFLRRHSEYHDLLSAGDLQKILSS